MTKIPFLLVFTPVFALAQTPKTAPDTDLPRSATVDVTVTDMQMRPLKGEIILFRGEKSQFYFTGITGEEGKLKQQLPPGDTYHVCVKSISDTTKYAVLNIPVLAEDEFFTEPFWVKVKYEPPRKWKLDHVHFDVDKSILRADALPQLSELLDYLQRHASVKVEIAGHTDNTGEESHNQQLSADRANSIRDWLIRKGISAYRLIAKGYGSTQPVADNSTEARRQLNRRTEARVL